VFFHPKVAEDFTSYIRTPKSFLHVYYNYLKFFMEVIEMKNAELYETHVKTINLKNAVAFYQDIGLELAYLLEDRRAAFFFLGNWKEKEQMLGVWEVPEKDFVRSHFAFKVSREALLNVPVFLEEKGVKVSPSFGLDASEPVVHAWMPAACYYFSDPDGNRLEYLAVIDGEPKPELGVVHLSVWENAAAMHKAN
jgi:catechol 2,3-dioxygenase-like lactoylglutathione lyase family enzyme